MEAKKVLTTLSRDCDLIDEAFRRLIEGTCCLDENDRPFLEDLFNKVQSAITDHISVEEELFFPHINAEEADLMRKEHIKLKDILREAHFAIVAQRSLTFKILLKELGSLLNQHTEIENHVLRAFQSGYIDHDKIEKIEGRVTNNLV